MLPRSPLTKGFVALALERGVNRKLPAISPFRDSFSSKASSPQIMPFARGSNPHPITVCCGCNSPAFSIKFYTALIKQFSSRLQWLWTHCLELDLSVYLITFCSLPLSFRGVSLRATLINTLYIKLCLRAAS